VEPSDWRLIKTSIPFLENRLWLPPNSQIKTTSSEVVNQFRKIDIPVALTRQNLGAEFFPFTHFSAPRYLQGQPRLFQKLIVEE